MENLSPQAAPSNGETRTERRRRRRTKQHGPLHLHRAQKRLLARAGVFLILLSVIIVFWYWMAVRK
jgi:cell division septal protein FtsQ